MKAVVMVSGGLASWATAKLASKKYEQVAYLFNDVLVEDADLYRFLLEGMANVLGVPAPTDLMRRALALPDVDSDANVEIRRAELAKIRAEAMQRLPGFTWLADGRTPFEAWHDHRFIGNSRLAHCSIELKAAVGDAWVDANCDAETVQEFGMYWDEGGRIEKLRRLKRRRIGDLLFQSGLTHSDIAAWAKCEGIPISRSYLYGYSHDNCSGLCCRSKPWRAWWIHETSESFVARTWVEAIGCLFGMVGNSFEDDEIQSGELDLHANTVTDEDGRTLTLAEWIAEIEPTEPFQLGTSYV